MTCRFASITLLTSAVLALTSCGEEGREQHTTRATTDRGAAAARAATHNASPRYRFVGAPQIVLTPASVRPYQLRVYVRLNRFLPRDRKGSHGDLVLNGRGRSSFGLGAVARKRPCYIAAFFPDDNPDVPSLNDVQANQSFDVSLVSHRTRTRLTSAEAPARRVSRHAFYADAAVHARLIRMGCFPKH